MRVLIGVLVLVACAWETHGRLEDWRSDQALFTAAVRVTPDAPRPMLNLGATLGRARDIDGAVRWTLLAHKVAERRKDRWLMARARRQLTWLDVLYEVCDRPEVRSACVSDSP